MDQFLRRRLSTWRSLQKLLHTLIYHGIQIRFGHDMLHQANTPCTVGVKSFACQEQFTAVALADLSQHEWGDHSRKNPQTRFTQAKLRPFHSHGNVTAAYQPYTTANGCSVYTPNNWFRARVNNLHQVKDRLTIGYILLKVIIRSGAHKSEVSPSAEGTAVSGKHDNAYIISLWQFTENGEQRLDHLRIHGIVHLRPV
jgi:hypothetical protein